MRNRYSITEFVKTSYAFLITKFTIRKARLIRRPVYIRGKKSLVGCRGLTTGYNCRFDLTGKKLTLFIGGNVWIGEDVVVLPGADIGKGSIIGANAVVKGKIPENSIAVGNPAHVVKNLINIIYIMILSRFYYLDMEKEVLELKTYQEI